MPLAGRASSVDGRILTIRGARVLLDADLAVLYGVPTKVLIQAVKRNVVRFPADFMYQLTRDEALNLRSQFVTSSRWGGRRHLPYAFTQEGVAMLSGVLRSPQAVRVNLEIMRAFVRLRRLAVAHEDLSRRLDDLERRHDRHDQQLRSVFDAIRALMTPPETPRRRIGFKV